MRDVTELPARGFDDAEDILTEALAQEAGGEEKQTRWQAFLRLVLMSRNIAIVLVGLIVFIYFSLATDKFLVPDSIFNMVRSVSLVGIVAVGMTFLFIAGELDLSVGSVFGFLTIVLGLLVVRFGWNEWLAALVVIALGLGIGMINGLITTRIGVPSFIVTLAGLTAYRSAALVVSERQPFPTQNSGFFYDITGGYIGELIPWLIIWMLVIAVIGAIILARTKFGYHVYATGGNLQAARNSGINTNRVKVICFMLTSALCGLIAALQFGYLHVAHPVTGGGYEFRVIGAVIVGGVALTGGRGTVLGSIVGAIIIGMITSGLVLLGFSQEFGDIATGSLIVITGTLDLVVRRMTARGLHYLEG